MKQPPRMGRLLSFFHNPGGRDEQSNRIYKNCWYARRDSNPQPSEPESDALSIEPLAHILFSGNIIADPNRFVKQNFRLNEIFSFWAGNSGK